ncbi:MAG TPA: phosphoribosyltransferase family protein [Armatimonadota bacterium]|nr:phosphoribosyltransferase family protein [Armatimonadota bacterium]HOM72034.1 phosphoribosyltransferase family protein [Armatimonadota bacterium]HPP73930.1 phosphoribosyltransferase family protein [Armatimonadota bacterium]
MSCNPPLLITGTESDNPFAIDIAVFCGQRIDISDVLSLKTYANSEFCPRFISDEKDMQHIGSKLTGSTIVVVSTASNILSRNELSWRNMLVARAAKDNGAERVVLVEPDLFYSAQDRGPRPEHGEVDFTRDISDYKKFDGQPFSSRFYAQSLALAGVDTVITVHNHSAAVRKLFSDIMPAGFFNLNPAEVFADYILNSDVTPSLHSGAGLLVCAPDKGARVFTSEVHKHIEKSNVDLLYIAKQRLGERSVESFIDPDSPCPYSGIKGRDVIVFDDMVRTGSTIRQCCKILKDAGANRVVFFVTHFYSSPEVRENLNTPDLDEIITTNTIPCILNRDMQGRLRRKMTVLKLEKWISRHVLQCMKQDCSHLTLPMYTVDMSSKNPRWR